MYTGLYVCIVCTFAFICVLSNSYMTFFSRYSCSSVGILCSILPLLLQVLWQDQFKMLFGVSFYIVSRWSPSVSFSWCLRNALWYISCRLYSSLRYSLHLEHAFSFLYDFSIIVIFSETI